MFTRVLVLTAAMTAAMGTTLLMGTASAAVPTATAASISAPADYVGPGDGCAAGTWTAKNDPICQTMLNPGKALDNAKKAAGDVMQTEKDVCTAWETQANSNFNKNFNNCKNLPGK